MRVSISEIALDGGTQPRGALCERTVGDYAEALAEGAEFPPIGVVYDGEQYWLWDGYHRTHAHIRLGREEIDAVVRQGTQEDAIILSCGANAEPRGLRRTNADKRRAVERLLRVPGWAERSSRAVADACGVTHPLVESVRSEVETFTTSPHESGKKSRIGQDGKTYAARDAEAERRAALREQAAAILQRGGPATMAETFLLRDAREAGVAPKEPNDVAEKQRGAPPATAMRSGSRIGSFSLGADRESVTTWAAGPHVERYPMSARLGALLAWLGSVSDECGGDVARLAGIVADALQRCGVASGEEE